MEAAADHSLARFREAKKSIPVGYVPLCSGWRTANTSRNVFDNEYSEELREPGWT
jgi:hypothetical protein